MALATVVRSLSGWSPSLETKSRGTCGRAEVLRGVSGSSPLDLLKTVGQRLLNEIPQTVAAYSMMGRTKPLQQLV